MAKKTEAHLSEIQLNNRITGELENVLKKVGLYAATEARYTAETGTIKLRSYLKEGKDVSFISFEDHLASHKTKIRNEIRYGQVENVTLSDGIDIQIKADDEDTIIQHLGSTISISEIHEIGSDENERSPKGIIIDTDPNYNSKKPTKKKSQRYRTIFFR